MLHYELFKCTNGEIGEFIVLLHGFGGNHRVWKNQIPVLQEKYNVLAIDLPSHYEGNKKLSEMKVTLENVTLEILEVLDNFNLKHTTFIGVSLGTIFIKYIEMYYPEYIDRAILVGAVGAVNLLLTNTVNLFAKIGDKLPFKVVYSTFSKVIMPLNSSKDSRKVFCKCAKALNCKEFRAWMKIFKEYFSFNEEFKLLEHKQNLYISGRFDICFLKGIREEVKQTKAKFIELKNSGHVCNIDQRAIFNRILEILMRHDNLINKQLVSPA